VSPAEPLRTVLRSATREVVIGHDTRFTLIGERINPTGRRIFQQQLRDGDLSAIERDVKAQVEGGADVLDINMGVPLTDEPELLAKAIQMVQELTDLPICIDSSVVEALEGDSPSTRAAPWSTRSPPRTTAWRQSCRW
jgi:5-methyltetrahydrofolate--homocysteine methyltransferase